MNPSNYQHYIWIETTSLGFRWHIARRDSKRVVLTSSAATYDEVIRDSEREFWRFERR